MKNAGRKKKPYILTGHELNLGIGWQQTLLFLHLKNIQERADKATPFTIHEFKGNIPCLKVIYYF